MKIRRGALAALLTALLAGCATNPMTGRSQLALMPEKTVIAQSASAYRAELAPFARKNKLNVDDAMVVRVRAVTDRLVAQAVRYRPDTAAWAWEVNVIDDPRTLNAFCLPGGKMAIYSGLMVKLKATDDEIGQVMGHEIGHALANHGAEKMSMGLLSDILVAALAGNSRSRQQTGDIASLLLWQLPNSRGAETEADRIGIELAARAGFAPDAAPGLWRKMMGESGEKGRFDLLSTHPASEARMETLAGLVPTMQPIYAQAVADPATHAVAPATRLAANVRDVTPGAPAPARMSPLTLVNPALENFRLGTVALKCEDCALGFANRQERLKELYGLGDWEALAREVVEAEYHQDISWFYLGAAAEGLGLPHARTYYQRAEALAGVKASHCRGVLADLCNGIELPRQAREALARLAP